MLILSFRWPPLLCMATVLLGWLATLTAGRKTSEVFKVLKDEDDMGGSCSSRFDQVDELIPEVEELLSAAINTIDKLLDDPDLLQFSKTKKKDRLRIVLLAQQFFGAEFSSTRLRAEENSKKSLESIKGNFKQVQNYIDSSDKSWRFACDDTWAPSVTELRTDYSSAAKGTAIGEVGGLSDLNEPDDKQFAFFDLGGPRLRPGNDETVQSTWYISRYFGWHRDGPCRLVQKPGQRATYPDAETVEKQKIIYFCPRVWESVGTGSDAKYKKDLRPLKDKDIPTDGSALLDKHASPATTLLHEMTHLVFNTDDDLGYFFQNVKNGRENPGKASTNADSYSNFAAAAYLSQVQWNTGQAREIGFRN